MAGTVSLSPERRWSAAGWLFDWVVEFLAGNVEDLKLRGELAEIVEENLGWLGLADFGPAAEREMRELLRGKVVQAADETFSNDMVGRDGVIELLRELARSA